MKKWFKNIDNILIKNTLILVGTSLIIKILSLLNRVFLTRLLGNDGISLYVLTLPTISLLLSLGGFSLSITISKIVSENEKKKEYSHKTILKSSIVIGLITSLITAFIFIFFVRYIAYDLLKQPDSFYPLLLSVTIIPFVALNNCYRGFYNGLDNVKYSAKANLIEQITRLLFAVIMLFLFRSYGTVLSVTISIIAMAVGEIISLAYMVSKVNKFLADHQTSESENTNLNKKILSISFSQTLSHLVANIAFFLEPIVYTFVLEKYFLSSKDILYNYSEVNAYTIPLLTMFFFTAGAIATVIIPTISKNQGTREASRLAQIALRLSLIPGIFLGVILFFYSDKYMSVLYNSTIGSHFTSQFAIIFALFYTQPVLIGILQATGNHNKLLIVSITDSIVKLALIYFLTFVKDINYRSLMYAVILTNILATIILYILAKRAVKFKISFKNIFKLIFLLIITFYTAYILKNFNIHYLLVTLISLIAYFLYIFLLKLNRFHDIK